MRLAKGFFLPFLAAIWFHYLRHPPTAGFVGNSRSLLVIYIVVVVKREWEKIYKFWVIFIKIIKILKTILANCVQKHL